MLTANTPIFILGFPRSGTSFVASLFAGAGLFKGVTFRGDSDNPPGYFENIGIRDSVVKRILETLECDTSGIDPMPEMSRVEEMEAPDLREQVETILLEDGWDGDSPWMFKDCKLALLWPLFAKAWPNAHWVFVQRPHMDIMQSCINTKFMAKHSIKPGYWADAISKYFARIELLREREANVYSLCPHDAIMGDDWSRFHSLFNELGLREKKDHFKSTVFEADWHGSPEGTAPALSWIEQNVDVEQLTRNVNFTLSKKVTMLQIAKEPLPPGTSLAIVGGGPSLEGQLDNLRELRQDGSPICATNGTHDYLLKNGIMPQFMVMMDAREHNVRFVENSQRDCAYLIASHVHMRVWATLVKRHATFNAWHCESAVDLQALMKKHDHPGVIVYGGTTVGMKCLNIGMMMGFVQFHLFGFDSCYTEKEHHAYEQTENDDDGIDEIIAGDKKFLVAHWMLRQAQDFQDFNRHHGDKVNLTLWGEGLLTHIIREGVKIQDQQEENAA